MKDNHCALTATQILERLNKQEISAVECLNGFRERIESQQNLNCVLHTDFEAATEHAAKIDQRRKNDEPVGLLAGLPVLVKDGICVAGMKTTAGSKILQDFSPPYDATVIQRLKKADAIIIGKTNMDEFAMGGSTENPHFGPAHNPWARNFVSGGSSGGSAATIASHMSAMALGSDTGGSIRQPAAFCGITGLKPTYGRVSRFGLIAFASSLDQIGPMTKSAADAALMLNVIGGFDERDSTSSNINLPDMQNDLSKSIRGKRIGVCADHLQDGVDDEIKAAVGETVKVMESLGAEISEVRLPMTQYAVAAYYVIASCEASSNLARYDGVRYTSRSNERNLEAMYAKTRADCFGPEVKRRIMLGTFALSSGYYDEYYLRASKVRRLIKNDYDKAFENVEAIIGPTVPTLPFKIGERIDDPLQMYLADVFTVSANLAGVPAISFPSGCSESGLPIGVQLQGRAFDEAFLLNVVHQYQSQTDWHLRSPVS